MLFCFSYDTLKQSFDLLAKNIREMTCGENSLTNRSGGANEFEDLLHRISNAVDGISMKLSKQEASQVRIFPFPFHELLQMIINFPVW